MSEHNAKGATSAERLERLRKTGEQQLVEDNDFTWAADEIERLNHHIDYVEEQATAASEQAKSMLAERDAEIERLRKAVEAGLRDLVRFAPPHWRNQTDGEILLRNALRGTP